MVERARSHRRRGSRAYIERTVGRSQDGWLGAATTFEVPASANSSEFTLTNNTAARKACALPESRNAGAFGRPRADRVRYRADLGCPRTTPRFIQNAPRDSILSTASDSVPAALSKVKIGVRFERDTPEHECSNCEGRVLSRKGGLLRTLYYVNAGASCFGFYLDEGALARANNGARFNSFGAVPTWAGEHDFEFVAKCEPERSTRVATEMRRNGGRI